MMHLKPRVKYYSYDTRKDTGNKYVEILAFTPRRCRQWSESIPHCCGLCFFSEKLNNNMEVLSGKKVLLQERGEPQMV